jgi:type IV pilus assembly protein PilC
MEFTYKAMTQKGKHSRGKVVAETRQEAIQELRQQGMFATQLDEQIAGGGSSGSRGRAIKSILKTEIHFGAKVKHRDFAIFARQLATLVKAGVPLAGSVRVLAQQADNKTFGKVLQYVAAELQKGNQLSEILVTRPDIFPKVFTNMIRAGEASGNLDDVLDSMALFFEKEHYTREKVKSALTYPIVVSVVALLVTTFLLIKIVPTFVNLFAGFHATLPLPTRIVLTASHFFVHQWYVLVAFVVLLVGGYLAMVRSEHGRHVRDVVLLKSPIFGVLFTKSVMARMARTLSTLIGSAVPVLQSLQLTAGVVQNEVVSRALRQCEDSLTSGQAMSEPLSRHWVFPPLIIQMVKVGEETGNLEYMLTKIADFYEAETEAMVDRLKSLIEPLMILFLAVVVGTIITAILTPMFSLYQQMGTMG